MKRISSFFAIFAAILLAAPAIQAQVTSVTYRQEGIASWYGNEFNGRPTASGEIFDSSQFTAAHPTLPFGTILTVTNIHNNRQVLVRVNDRGPFVAARIIDLSRAAAEALDMIITGTAPVIIESTASISSSAPLTTTPTPQPAQAQTPVYTPDPIPTTAVSSNTTAQTYTPAPEPQLPAASQIPPVTAPPTASAAENTPANNLPPGGTANIVGGIPATGTGKHYRLQVGAYRIPRNAVETFDKLKSVGLDPRYEVEGDIYRVVLPNLNPEEIPSAADKLYLAGFTEALLREER